MKTRRDASRVMIPESVQREHEAIHDALAAAMAAPGRVGAAARVLAEVIHPHFVREEEIALQPLGALASLAAGLIPAGADALLSMSDALRDELPRLRAEHMRIRAAADGLRAAARAEGSAQYERLADDLTRHALTEEQVLYPAAILAGEVIRARRRGHATTVSTGTAGAVPFGLARPAAGVAFCLGLILVVVGGAELFTGNALIAMAWASGRPSRSVM